MFWEIPAFFARSPVHLRGPCNSCEVTGGALHDRMHSFLVDQDLAAVSIFGSSDCVDVSKNAPCIIGESNGYLCRSLPTASWLSRVRGEVLIFMAGNAREIVICACSRRSIDERSQLVL